MLGCQPSTLTQRSMHHQKSSSDSPFHANTLKPIKRQEALYAQQTEECETEKIMSLQDYVKDIKTGEKKRDRCHTKKTPRMHRQSHLPLPEQLPLRSGWSRCYRLPICTEPLKPIEFPSAPEEEGGASLTLC